MMEGPESPVQAELEGALPQRFGSVKLDESDSRRPLYTTCVLLKLRRDTKAEAKPEELLLARKYFNKPYLLVLTPQDVKLYATHSSEFSRAVSSAADSSGEGGEVMERSKPSVAELPSFIANAVWVGPLTRATVQASKASASRLQGSVARMVPAPLRPKPSDAAPPTPPVGDGEEVPPGAVASHSVALSQLLEVQQQGAAVHVTFRRQHPSTKFMGVVRDRMQDTAEKLLMPWGSSKGSSRDAEQDQLQRSCSLVLADEAAAEELAAELQKAQQRLSAAVQWIARGLPLNDRLAAIMVTAQPGAAPPAADRPAAQSPVAVGAHVLACGPAWGAPIPVPARYTQQAVAAAPGAGPALVVSLYTPKGPHAATLDIGQLMAAHSGGQELLVVEAQPLLPAHACQGGGALAGASDQLRVMLHARMQPLEAPGAAPQEEEPPLAAPVLRQPQLLSAGVALAAVLAAWLQLLAGGGLAAAGMVQLAALLLATAAAGLVLRSSFGQPTRAAVGQPSGGRSLALVLLQASLVAAADMQQVAAEAGVGPGKEGEAEAEAGSRLPKKFRHLVARHPDVLDENMAERFVASYPSPSKAYAALQQCVEWRQARGMVGLLDRPHPKFAAIKHRYPHAALGWSRKKDCLVTLDCYGVWKQSYDALKADGVSEEELLAHLMLCFDFYFSRLDPRPLPHGKSINIVDLAGLKMSDAAGEAFRFISKAGALLNLHFPLRLRKAFLINAPSWWGVVWRLVSPLIDSKTRELMALYSAKEKDAAAAAMLEWIDADVLPREYGGNSAAGLYDSELERRFWRHVESQNSVPGTGNSVPEATAAEEAGSPSDAPSLPATVDLGAMG